MSQKFRLTLAITDHDGIRWVDGRIQNIVAGNLQHALRETAELLTERMNDLVPVVGVNIVVKTEEEF